MNTLIAEISEADFSVIRKAGERIVLVKNIGIGVPVAWTCLSPGVVSTFEWGYDYSLFATTAGSEVGTPVTMAASTFAQTRCAYTFGPTQTFGSVTSDPSLGPNECRIDNRVPASVSDAFSFGFAQAINDPQPQPLNAQYVPPIQSLLQSACESVTIWLQSDVEAGQAVAIPSSGPGMNTRSVRSYCLVLDFSRALRTQTVRYSSRLGRFERV